MQVGVGKGLTLYAVSSNRSDLFSLDKLGFLDKADVYKSVHVEHVWKTGRYFWRGRIEQNVIWKGETEDASSSRGLS